MYLCAEFYLRDLSKNLSDEQALVQLLQKELEKSRLDIENTRKAHSSQKLALERENDLLREQLKKYVSMVQVQRKETPSISNSDSLTSSTSGKYNTVTVLYIPGV